jgi:hypothetical protein
VERVGEKPKALVVGNGCAIDITSEMAQQGVNGILKRDLIGIILKSQRSNRFVRSRVAVRFIWRGSLRQSSFYSASSCDDLVGVFSFFQAVFKKFESLIHSLTSLRTIQTNPSVITAFEVSQSRDLNVNRSI